MADPIATKKSHRVYQVIDLKEVFGVSFKKNQELKQKIAQALIDKMKERIEQGIGYDGQPMKAYSKEYKESDEYIAARKTGVVNMTLSGDMMGSIDVIKEKTNEIVIGFNQREQELKANRHMRGEGGVPVREFFGVSEDEIKEVKREFSSELKDIKKDQSPSQGTGSVLLEELRREISATDTFNGVFGNPIRVRFDEN
jgi:hypothetical protein